jgi:hypothetical protein
MPRFTKELRQYSVLRIFIFLLSASVVGLTAHAYGAATSTTPTIKEDAHPLPVFTGSIAPSVSSCDVKSGQGDSAVTIPGTGNNIVDATSTAALDIFNGTKSSDTTIDNSSDVKKGVGIGDADACGALPSVSDDKADAKEVACTDAMNSDYIARIFKENNAARNVIACQRGVLAAVKGEFGCFANQLDAAQSYVGQLMNGPMNTVITNGQKAMTDLQNETTDRQSQLDTVNKRISDPKTGLDTALTTLNALNISVPAAQAKLTNMQTDIATLTAQSTMAKTMDCLNSVQPNWPSCIKPGTTSSKYKTNPTPIEYLQCIYAQSANLSTGNGATVVNNSTAETAHATEVAGIFGIGTAGSSLNVPTAKTVATFNTSTGVIDGSIGSYTVNTPADLNTAIAPLLAEVLAATKNNPKYASLVTLFKQQITTCNQQATAQVLTNTQNFMRTVTGNNASQMRSLASTYQTAIQAATGRGDIQLNTSTCETAALADQVSCMARMGQLVDAIINGNNPGAGSGVASTLTNKQNGIFGFSSAIPASNVPARALTVDCSGSGGLKSCLAQYVNYQTALTSTLADLAAKKVALPNSINSQIQTIATCIASGGQGAGQSSCAGTGATTGMGMSLNALSANLAAAKGKVVSAMAKMGISDSLNLAAVKTGDLDKDPTTGVYTQAALKSLLLGAVSPPLLSNDADAFKSAKDEISDKDKEFAKSQKGMKDYEIALKARAADCTNTIGTKTCDKIKDFQTAFCKDSSDAVASAVKNYVEFAKAASALGKTDDAIKYNAAALAASKNNIDSPGVGESKGTGASATTGLTCATAPQAYQKACGFGDGVTDLLDKGSDGTGGKSRSGSLKVSSGG